MAPVTPSDKITYFVFDFGAYLMAPCGGPQGVTQYRPFGVKVRVILASMTTASKSTP